MKIILNGTDIDDPIDGVSSIKVRHRIKDEQGRLAKSFSQELTFYGQGYNIIKNVLIDDPAGKFNKVSIIIIDDCCGQDRVVFTGIIRGDTIDWCEGECYVKVQAIEETEDTLANDCMRSKLISDNTNGFQQDAHPRIVYCNEFRPSGLQDVVMILGIIVNLIWLLSYPFWLALGELIAQINFIIAVINAIINAINNIPGINIGTINPIDLDGDLDTNYFEDLQNILEELNERIIGCGRKHPSPLLRDYITNICTLCGLEWSSSILKNQNSQYWNTVYFHAPVEKGTRDESTLWIDKNKPVLSGEGLLDQLKLVFNADYRVINGTLEFERKDYFYAGANWLTYDTLKAQDRLIEKICYSWRDEDVWALARYEYTDDPVDWVGNEAKNRFSDIVEWNIPFSPLQKDIKEHFIPFSPPRFRPDGVDRDVLGTYSWFPIFGGVINQYQNAMIMNNGTAFQAKLLIWDGGSISNSYVKKYNIQGFDADFSENFNFPYMFNEHNVAPLTAYPQNEPDMGLYGRFHSIDHPKLLQDQGKEFEFTFKFDCGELQTFDITKLIQTPLGAGRIEWAEFDYVERTCIVFGKV